MEADRATFFLLLSYLLGTTQRAGQGVLRGGESTVAYHSTVSFTRTHTQSHTSSATTHMPKAQYPTKEVNSNGASSHKGIYQQSRYQQKCLCLIEVSLRVPGHPALNIQGQSSSQQHQQLVFQKLSPKLTH